MKKTLVHRGLFIESLRRLRLATILLTAIPTAVMLMVSLVNILNGYQDIRDGYRVYTSSYDWFYEVYWFLPALPFVVPVILSALLLSQQNKRCDSDFYHSLPLTKRQLGVTWFAAIATATSFTVLASSLVVFVFDLLDPARIMPDWDAVVLPVFGACLAALMVTAVLFLSYQVSGNAVSALMTAVLIIFAPHLITAAFSTAIAESISVVSVETLNTFQYVTLFWSYDSVITWLVTIAVTAVCFLLGVLAANRRPSEVAGQAAVSKALQIILRLSLSFVVCLPSILIITESWWMENAVVLVFYVLAVAVYLLFELFTTKKAKNMLKSLPWLGVLVALNIVSILGVNLAIASVENFRPEADEIQSVTVSELRDITYYGIYDSDCCIPESSFYPYKNVYNKSDCVEVKLADYKSKDIVANALAKTLDDGKYWYSYESSYDFEDGSFVACTYYEIEVEIHMGLVTRTRIIWVTDAQLRALLRAINEVETLPASHYYNIPFTPHL